MPIAAILFFPTNDQFAQDLAMSLPTHPIDSAKRLLDQLRVAASLRLLRRTHRITQRLPVVLRQLERAKLMVIAPHMDDDVIGPGGALALHQQLGSEAEIVFCAAGADTEQDRVRKAEARAGADFMGFSRLEFLDFPEGRLSLHEARIARKLAECIATAQPEQIFCPFLTDHHRDHNAVAQAVATATAEASWSGEIWCYEVWSPLWPNVAVDISTVADRKRRAIELHASQVAGLHYPDGILGLNRYRALRVYVDYAEAYYVCGARSFQRLARLVDGL